MSIPEPANLRPLDLAKTEIEAWRGRCLNTFARAEKAVTKALEKMREGNPAISLELLAGQRLKTLEKLVKERLETNPQKVALEAALSNWQASDKRRPFFSHGIVTELADRNGDWRVQLDFIAVKQGKCEAQRLNWSKAEALEFEKRLKAAFEAVSSQLGQLRKRL